jgi:hypothetical protein
LLQLALEQEVWPGFVVGVVLCKGMVVVVAGWAGETTLQ